MCDVCGPRILPNPKSSIQFIALNRRHIRINNMQLLRLGMKIVNLLKNNIRFCIEFPEIQFPPKVEAEKTLDWFFVVNLLNFGFCSKPNTRQWTFKNQTGYLGICHAINCALQRGYDILNPKFYSRITQAQVEDIFRGDHEMVIPMALERTQALNQTGNALIRYYRGTFRNCILEARQSALQLLNLITRYFPYFCDKGYYENFEVIFHRKAQLLIINIWHYCRSEGMGRFHDIEQLATIRTIHQLQQLYLYYNILEYSEELKGYIKSLAIVPNGCREEIEIRGCTIYVTEMLRILINETLKDKKCINPLYVDYLVTMEWKLIADMAYRSEVYHHMSRSVFY